MTCLGHVLLVDPSIFLHGREFLAADISTHLLFVHDLFAWTSRAVNGPSWSTGVEMQFYLLMLLAAP